MLHQRCPPATRQVKKHQSQKSVYAHIESCRWKPEGWIPQVTYIVYLLMASIFNAFWQLLIKITFQQLFIPSLYRKKKVDNTPKDKIPPERPKDTPWEMMDDVILQYLVKEVKESILPLDDEREKSAALARSELIQSPSVDASWFNNVCVCVAAGVRLVSEVMGGEVQMEKLHEFPWLLHLSELKLELQSNVIPIGLIRYGFFCHRALLFKVELQLPCFHDLIRSITLCFKYPCPDPSLLCFSS